jgi:DNA-binding NtrC family response regulator
MIRVLIVDDNRELAENLGELLELEGFAPTVMSSSRLALDRVKDLELDAAVLDVRMPDVDGIELCAALSHAHPHARIVLVTAFTAERRLADAENAGALIVLPKPVPLDRLFEALERPNKA